MFNYPATHGSDRYYGKGRRRPKLVANWVAGDRNWVAEWVAGDPRIVIWVTDLEKRFTSGKLLEQNNFRYPSLFL